MNLPELKWFNIQDIWENAVFNFKAFCCICKKKSSLRSRLNWQLKWCVGRRIPKLMVIKYSEDTPVDWNLRVRSIVYISRSSQRYQYTIFITSSFDKTHAEEGKMFFYYYQLFSWYICRVTQKDTSTCRMWSYFFYNDI